MIRVERIPYCASAVNSDLALVPQLPLATTSVRCFCRSLPELGCFSRISGFCMIIPNHSCIYFSPLSIPYVPFNTMFAFILFVAAALGLAPPIANPAMNLQSQSLSLVNTSNAFPATSSPSKSNNDSNIEAGLCLHDNVQYLNVTNEEIRCDGASYGYDLNKNSCLDAWMNIPADSDFTCYGKRAMGTFQAPLPVRYLSCKSPTQIQLQGLQLCFGLLMLSPQTTVSALSISTIG